MPSINQKTTFALFFGNRGFFPAALIAAARQEMTQVLNRLGHKTILLDAGATRKGGIETPAEGERYAQFLKANAGKFGGVILCLPNFGDENGAVAALRDAGVPILVQAYPDEPDKMAPALRRDSFCGKCSIMDVFYQNRIPFTVLKPHTVAPASEKFAGNVEFFDRVCRVVNSLKRMVVGALGARTTAFKTVRIDELTLQRHGITVETFDLSDIFARMAAVKPLSPAYRAKARQLLAYADFSRIPKPAVHKLTQLGVAFDNLQAECRFDALAIRCWMEMQELLGISPCVLLSEMNNRGLPAACEVDVGNAVAMAALSRASGDAAACLDWNNNYGDDEDKCILFHCGPVPQSLMTARGKITNHAIIENALGPGCTYGCNTGRIRPTPFTFSSLMTENGRMRYYVGEGNFTDDPIADDFFGCAGVAQVDRLQDVLLHIGRAGHRHHVSVTPGRVTGPLREALVNYLGGEVSLPQQEQR